MADDLFEGLPPPSSNTHFQQSQPPPPPPPILSVSTAKFSKASKLAIQLIVAGSVKSGVSDYFFAILEAAMLSPVPCTDPSVRADYHSLFSAAQDAKEHFNKKQKNQLATWIISVVVANDLYTDDSFVEMRSILERYATGFEM